jgi:hypothetical protein
VLIIILALSLFVANGITIRADVRAHDRLYVASTAIDHDHTPDGFEYAVVTVKGSVKQRSTLFADADMSHMVFRRRYNVLERMRQRCSTGGGFLKAYNCSERGLVPTLMYTRNRSADGTDMIVVNAIKKK